MTAPNADGGEAGFGSQRDAAPDSRPPSAGPKHETKGADAELAGLRARLARCETLLAAVAPIQWTLAADGRCMQANPSWEEFTGQDQSAARGTGWLVAIHPDDRDKTVAAWREATSNRQAVRLAHRVRRRDGAFRWMEMHAAPVRDPATGVQAWAGLHTDVSEQYAAMETAQANEVRLRLALKAGGLASWDLDVGTGRIVTAGDLPEMFGIEPVTLNGTVAPFVARIHPEDRTGVLREFAAAARQGGAYRCEFRVVRATDGAIRWLVGVAEGVRGIDGSVHVIGYNADVTDQVEAEAALSDSEARFRATFQQAAVGIAQLTPDGRWLRVNDRFCAITGYSREALLARRFQDITHPDDLEADLAQVQALLEGRIARYSLEKRYIRPDGAVEWVNLTVSLVRDAGGAPDYFISVVEDITPRKQAEAALAESEARLRLATEAGQVGVFDWDLRTDELRWDDQLRAIWALPIGTTVTPAVFFAGLCPEDRKQLQAVIETCRDPANGEHFAAEYRVIGQTDGAERHVAARWRVEFEHGSAVRIIGTAADVTPLRRAAEVLAHDKAELERLVEQRTAALLRAADDRRRAEESARQAEKLAALGSLTGGVAHDFNNLLQVIASGAELLKRGHLTGERRAKLLDGIAQAGERGRDLTGRLLSFARRQPLRPTLVDVTARLARMSELLRQTLGSRIQVVTDIAPELWPVRAGASQLEVALLNLAVNGRDAMPNGGTVTIAARNERLPATGNRPAGDYVRISVRDTGKGMPANVLARALEPFFTTKEPGRGTGLGLAQVHGFARQSGGDLGIESEPGRGTTVFLHLPCAVAMPVAAATSAAAVPAIPLPVQGAGRTVLVVEDNVDVAAFTCELLAELGYLTHAVGTADQALALVADGLRIDAAFSDVVLPGRMSGIDLAIALRAKHPQVAVLLATGYGEQVVPGTPPPDVATLRKPYLLDDLATALQEAFARTSPPG